MILPFRARRPVPFFLRRRAAAAAWTRARNSRILLVPTASCVYRKKEFIAEYTSVVRVEKLHDSGRNGAKSMQLRPYHSRIVWYQWYHHHLPDRIWRHCHATTLQTVRTCPCWCSSTGSSCNNNKENVSFTKKMWMRRAPKQWWWW